MMDADEWALPPNEDLDVARRLDETVEGAELFLYPGDRHLFADNSPPDYDENAATLLKQRVLSFLDNIEWLRSLYSIPGGSRRKGENRPADLFRTSEGGNQTLRP